MLWAHQGQGGCVRGTWMIWGGCRGFAEAVGLAMWAQWQPVPMHVQAERRLQALEGKESRAQRRLRELAQRITALRERGRDTRRMAQQAKDGAQRATAASGTLSQVSLGPAWPQHSTERALGAGGFQPHHVLVPPGPGTGDAALRGAEGSSERACWGVQRGPAACDTADSRGPGPSGQGQQQQEEAGR